MALLAVCVAAYLGWAVFWIIGGTLAMVGALCFVVNLVQGPEGAPRLPRWERELRVEKAVAHQVGDERTDA